MRKTCRFAPTLDRLEGREVLSNVLPTFTNSHGALSPSAADLGEKVSSLYGWVLHRAPTPAEQSFYVNKLQSGAGFKSVMAGFLNSPEFNASHPIPGDFVQALYVGVLDRVGYAEETAYWLHEYGTGVSRSAIVARFLNSPEAQTSPISILHSLS